MTEVINITTNLTGADRVRDGLSSITSGLGSLTKIGATAIAGFAAASAAGFVTAAKHMIDYGDSLQKMSQKTGVSVEALSQLKYAADLSDVSIAQLETAFKFMNKAVAEAESGTGAAAKAFAALNINYDVFKQLKPEDQFTVVAEKLTSVRDASEKTQLAMTLFGRSGLDMLPMLADGAAGLEKMRGAADDMGLTMSSDSAKAMETFNDAMTTLGAAVTGAVQRIIVDFVPALVAITDWLGDIIPAAGAIFSSAFEGIRQVILRVSEYALLAFGKMAQAIGWLAEKVGVDAFSKWGDTLVEISDSLKVTADDYASISKEVVTVTKEQKNLDAMIEAVTGSTLKNKEATKDLAKAEKEAAEKRQRYFEDANDAHKQVLDNLDAEINAMEKRDKEDAQSASNESARIQRILNEEVEAMDKRDIADADNRQRETERREAAIAGMSEWEKAWLSYEIVAAGVFGTVNEYMVGSVADARQSLGNMFGDILTKTTSVGDAIKGFFSSVKDSILRSLGEILADKIWQTMVSAFVGGSSAGAGLVGGVASGAAGAGLGSLLGTGAAGGAATGAIGMEAAGGASFMSAALPWLAAAGITVAALKNEKVRETGRSIEDKVRNIGSSIADKFGFATGTDSVFSRPTMFLAGENGPERVQVTPMNQKQGGGSGGHTYNFYGPVMMDQIAMDKFQRGLMAGIGAQQGRYA